jgi:hypothetical protein
MSSTYLLLLLQGLGKLQKLTDLEFGSNVAGAMPAAAVLWVNATCTCSCLCPLQLNCLLRFLVPKGTAAVAMLCRVGGGVTHLIQVLCR